MAECVLAAAYLINRTPSTLLHDKTTYEILHGKKPVYKHLRILGLLCYIHNQDTKGDKFHSRSRKCVLVGYPYGKKGWRVFDLERQSFCVSRDVIFQEDMFPFSSNISDTPVREDEFVSLPVLTEVVSTEDITPTEGVVESQALHDENLDPVTEESGSETDNTPVPDTSGSENDNVEHIDREGTELPVPPLATTGLRRSGCTPHPPAYLADYQTGLVCSNSKVLYPIDEVLSSARFSVSHKSFLAAITTAVIPKTFEEAMRVILAGVRRCSLRLELLRQMRHGVLRRYHFVSEHLAANGFLQLCIGQMVQSSDTRQDWWS
ncbi:Retrovirus-related Pol polyprotein from transposon RE1 [Cardamine amara subsp. amara]|uniref:Retrovirus-related Pol polyprotein from transposon RE1 n=1 Tax=Cardamine amara subsp. amara TaxID=228776 RepID=A0ABD1BI71_CARAN